MAITICPHCHQSYNAEDDIIGTKVECAVCHAEFLATDSAAPSKPISKHTGSFTLMSCLGVKSLAWVFVVCVMIIIVQSIMLIYLFTQRGAAVSSSNPAVPSVSSANSMQTGTPSELLLKYAEQGELSYVEAVLRQNPTLDVNRPRAAGNKTALYIACEKGYADVAKFLLDKKADPTICDTEKVTLFSAAQYSPLTIAVKNGHIAVVKVLISSGVDVETRDDNNRTALFAATVANKPDIIRFLCESNAKVNTKINIRGDSLTLLTVAARKGYTEAIKALLKYGKGIDLEMRDYCSRTPLYCAAEENHPDVINVLCKAGADLNVRCGVFNQTPIGIASLKRYQDAVDVLEKYKAERQDQERTKESSRNELDKLFK